jgi:hypothetical protein
MAIGIAGDNPSPPTLTQLQASTYFSTDQLDQLLTELRTQTALLQIGLNVIDEPNAFRNDPSNNNPTLS